MKPTLDFHGIASVELTPVMVLQRNDGRGTFATRTLVLTDAKGERFDVGLFAETEAALVCAIEAQKPKPVLTTVSELAAQMDRAADKAHDDAGNTPPPAIDPKTGKEIPW